MDKKTLKKILPDLAGLLDFLKEQVDEMENVNQYEESVEFDGTFPAILKRELEDCKAAKLRTELTLQTITRERDDMAGVIDAQARDLERFMLSDLAIKCECCGRTYQLEKRTIPPRIYICNECGN